MTEDREEFGVGRAEFGQTVHSAESLKRGSMKY
jgi:hypothetical protein